MIQVSIEQTGKSFSPKSQWTHLDSRPEIHNFETMAEAKAYLKERYGSCKRQPMFSDGLDGSVKRVGYVYGFRNADWSHSPVESWLQQDWVGVFQVEPVAV